MKAVVFAVLFTLACTCAFVARADEPSERAIRELEMRDAKAVLNGDFATMEKTWADDFAVNSPPNRITKGKQEVLKLIRRGNIGTYEREIESITLRENTAIVMGMETVQRTSEAAPTKDVVRRRYMNVWTKRGAEC